MEIKCLEFMGVNAYFHRVADTFSEEVTTVLTV